ncbi:MAG: transglutaminaseTgpA domain-containing protein [Elusimicrobiota bacterium]|nr:transglutaminaseTgpA domain-containing protein [Elusimicrobiota bacterium]
MRPTRLGLCAAALALLTLFAAGSTGNNLLYLLFASATASLAVSVLLSRRMVRSVAARYEEAGQAFRGSSFVLPVVLESRGAAARLLRVAGPGGAVTLDEVPAGRSARVELRLSSPSRGLAVYDSLVLECAWPFGLVIARRALPPAEVLVLPAASPFVPQAALESDPRSSGPAGAARAKGRDGEFWGPRPHAPEDDARLIHWKLTAKTGRPVVAELAAAPQDKAVVRLQGTDDASVEAAAAACRWHADAGTEVGLVGPGLEMAPGRGLKHLDGLLRALAQVGDGARPRPVDLPAPPRDGGPVDGEAQRRLLLAGSVLVWASLFLIDEVSPRLLLALSPVLPVSWFLHLRGGPFLPAFAWSLLSFGVLVFMVFFDWRWSGVALANVHLLGYLVINRLLNPWKAAELRQVFLIFYLAFFLASGLTISPWYFPLFVLYLGFAAAWLSLQAGAPPARWRSWGPALGGALAGGAALAVAVFLATPRVEGLRRFNPFLASGIDKLQVRSQSVTGFTERVSLGHFGTLRKSSARVMRVRPEKSPPEGVVPPPLYVRGSAFDFFDGRTWGRTAVELSYRSRGGPRRSAEGRAWAWKGGGSLVFPNEPKDRAAPVWEFTISPMNLTVLFTVGGAWIAEGVDAQGWFDHTDSLHLAAPYLGGVRYRLYSLPDGSWPSDAAASARPAILEKALALPPTSDGRIAALAQEWTRGLADPEAKVETVVARLRDEYGYSTFSDGKNTSLEHFLFTGRRGNCEYFATAAAVLLRHAGVPTRLVSGFLVDGWNEYGLFYDVRQSDAHAWFEAYLPGKGWTRFDATPGQTRLSGAADAAARRLERWLDALQVSWYRHVIGYDQYAQRDTFLKLGVGQSLSRLRDRFENAVRPLLALLLLGFVVHAAAVLLALRVFRRGDEFDRAAGLLARAGLRREPWQTPREFAAAVKARRPELAALEELAEAKYRRVYAGEPASDEERRRLARLLADLKSQL